MCPFYGPPFRKASAFRCCTCRPFSQGAAADDAVSSRPLESVLRSSFRNAGATSKKRGQIRINKWCATRSHQIARRFETGKKCVGDLAPRHTLFAVTRGNIAGPVTNVLTVRPILRSQENRGMSMLVSSDLARPENLHEVTWLRLIDVFEISTE